MHDADCLVLLCHDADCAHKGRPLKETHALVRGWPVHRSGETSPTMWVNEVNPDAQEWARVWSDYFDRNVGRDLRPMIAWGG